MHIDCDACAVRGLRCGDCVVSVLLGMPAPRVELDDSEQAALAVLADQGLVPPLRLVADWRGATRRGEMPHQQDDVAARDVTWAASDTPSASWIAQARGVS